ncbi:hypothetical protein I4U23_006287 [Adineta vaga]|nr:hypothetical protein I4U23_006287 [Adineta vaga]
MAPLTLSEKYDDLVRCADQPLSSYDKLTDKDLEDVISKSWPFLIQSITYTPSEIHNSFSTMILNEHRSKIHIELERRLKIRYQLYSEAAKRSYQKFPNRIPFRQNRPATAIYLKDSDTLSFDRKQEDKKHFHQQQINYNRVLDYIKTTTPFRMLVFKQALKECCHCGNYNQLKNLCLAVDTSIEQICFDNNNTILHESIISNNRQLTRELIRFQFNINIHGEFGTPLVTAIHYDILWAVELLLKNGADLAERHIDWPFWTLYEYCIEFRKIEIKLIISKHIRMLIQKHKYTIIQNLMKNGWNID